MTTTMPLDEPTVGLTIVVLTGAGWVVGTVTDWVLGLVVVDRVVDATVVFAVDGLVVVGLTVVAAGEVLVDGLAVVEVGLRDVEVVARLVKGAVGMGSDTFGIAMIVVSDDRWTVVIRSVSIISGIEDSRIL